MMVFVLFGLAVLLETEFYEQKFGIGLLSSVEFFDTHESPVIGNVEGFYEGIGIIMALMTVIQIIATVQLQVRLSRKGTS